MTDPDRQLWMGMLAHLRRHHSPVCRQWFEELDPLGVVGGALSLRTSTDLHRDYLRRVCAEAFTDAARTVSGHLISVRFLGPEDDAPEYEPRPRVPGRSASTSASRAVDVFATHHTQAIATDPQRAGVDAGARAGGTANLPGLAATTPTPPYSPTNIPPYSQTLSSGEHPGQLSDASRSAASWRETGAGGGASGGAGDGRVMDLDAAPARDGHAPVISRKATQRLRRDESLVINPDYGFENFVVGPGNRLPHAAAMAVGSNPGRTYNPLFVHGGVGLGKTHLLQAICLKVLEANPDAIVYYISCESFVTQFMESVQSGAMADFRHRFRDVDVLVIDDIHFLAKRDRTQEEFFHTFNSLYQASKQIILSSDAAPSEIPDLEERLVSRFKWGLVAKIEPPCYETRVAILKTKSRLRGIALPDECACHIAARIDSNIRELEGAIVRLQIQSSVENRPIDLDMVKNALGDVEPITQNEPNIQSIIGVVTEYYRLRLTDLQSKRRHRSVAVPRQVCMYLARRNTRLSLEEIGGYFGGRDHTTVMHGIKAVELRREAEPDFHATVRTLEDKLKSAPTLPPTTSTPAPTPPASTTAMAIPAGSTAASFASQTPVPSSPVVVLGHAHAPSSV